MRGKGVVQYCDYICLKMLTQQCDHEVKSTKERLLGLQGLVCTFRFWSGDLEFYLHIPQCADSGVTSKSNLYVLGNGSDLIADLIQQNYKVETETLRMWNISQFRLREMLIRQ